jgi:hypothetical protein
MQAPGYAIGGVSSLDEQRREESLKMGFEIAKHISTLNIATSVVLLTLYRDIGVTSLTLVYTLLVFLVSLVLSYFTMTLLTGLVAAPEGLEVRLVHWKLGIPAATRLLNTTGSLYVAGLVVFVLGALGVV